MKIAIFRPRWAKNNTAFEVQARLYVYLRKKYDLEITVFADKENRFQYEGLNVVNIERGAPGSLFSGFKQPAHNSEANYPQWKLLNGYDAIETSDPTLYEYAQTAFKAAGRFGSRLVCGSSVTLPDLVKTDLQQAKKIMDFAYKISCCTPKAQERFVKLGVLEKDSARVVILGHPIDLDLFRPTEHPKENDVTRIISVGRLDENKGHHVVLQAVDNLYRQGLKFEWDIFGKGNRGEYLKEEVSRLDLSSVVHFHGMVPNEKLPDYYRQSDIFVLHQFSTPKWEEYFGVALAEAMACGVPVVSTNTGGIPYVVKVEETGYLVEPGDVESLKVALKNLVTDVELRKRVGEAGRKHVEENFAMDVVARRYLQLWGVNNAG